MSIQPAENEWYIMVYTGRVSQLSIICQLIVRGSISKIQLKLRKINE